MRPSSCSLPTTSRSGKQRLPRDVVKDAATFVRRVSGWRVFASDELKRCVLGADLLDLALLLQPYSLTLYQAIGISLVLTGVLVTIFFGAGDDSPASGYLFRHPVKIAVDIVILVVMLVFLGPLFWRMFTPAIPGF
jgi:hypothetical protein